MTPTSVLEGQEGGAHGLHAQALGQSQCNDQTSDSLASGGGAFAQIPRQLLTPFSHGPFVSHQYKNYT